MGPPQLALQKVGFQHRNPINKYLNTKKEKYMQ